MLLYNFLVNCDVVVTERSWNVIDKLGMLVYRLSNALTEQWNRLAYNIRKEINES